MHLALPEVLRELLPQGPVAQPDELEIKDLFLQLWPDQAKNLASYRAKPGCSCRGHIQKAMAQDMPKLTAFVDALKRLRGKTFFKAEDPRMDPAPAAAPSATPTVIRPPPLRHLQGQTRDIADTPEAYRALLKELQSQGLRFTGLTVRPVGEHGLRVYFY